MKALFFPFLFWLLAQPFSTLAQDSIAAAPANFFNRLQQYDPLEVVIELNLQALKTDSKEEAWVPAVFKIMKGGQVDFEQPIQVTSRGNMRRKTCSMPPLKIRFFDAPMGNDSLEDVNELKMVLGCRNTATDDELVLKECLVYELYNLVSDASFRVKRATVSFRKPGKKRATLETAAFFIESEQELATRLGGRPLKVRMISPHIMDTLAYDRMCLFQFMIGNTDWATINRHNIKVIAFRNMEKAPPQAIPYDFDYAGIVGADYAVPSPNLPIKTVQERCYRGLCRDAASYDGLFQEFAQKKDILLSCCQDFTPLSKSARQQMKTYLSSFFNLLEEPQKLRKEIMANCNKGD